MGGKRRTNKGKTYNTIKEASEDRNNANVIYKALTDGLFNLEAQL